MSNGMKNIEKHGKAFYNEKDKKNTAKKERIYSE